MRAGVAAASLALLAAGCGSGVVNAESSVAAPFPTDSGFVQSGDASLFYRTLGSGPALLVLHGGPGLEHSYLLPGLEPLARDHRLIFYDQRGSGRSDAPLDSSSISLENFLADLDRVSRQVAGGEATILGHSWGGLLAVLYASRYPERVRSLVLMSPIEPGQRYREETTRRQRAGRSSRDSAAIAELVDSKAFRSRNPEAVNQLYRLSFRSTFADTGLASRLPVDFTARTARAAGTVPELLLGPLGDYDFWDRLERIQAPALVVHGSEDPIPSAMAREMSRRMPDARFELISAAGHFPFVEAPEALFSPVRRFLKGREAGG